MSCTILIPPFTLIGSLFIFSEVSYFTPILGVTKGMAIEDSLEYYQNVGRVFSCIKSEVSAFRKSVHLPPVRVMFSFIEVLPWFVKVRGNSTVVEFYSSHNKPHSWEEMNLLGG